MNNEQKDNIKKLSVTKIVYLVALLSFMGMIILYAGGTFVSPKIVSVKATNNSANVDHNHNSADMTVLAEIKSLESKINNNPDDLNSLLSLSHLLNDSGFYEKAIKNYKKYLLKSPNNVDVIIDMGVCYFQVGDYNSAILVMEKGISLNPKHQIAYFNLGIVNSAKGDVNKSKEYLMKAIKIDPNSNIGIKAQNLLDNH